MEVSFSHWRRESSKALSDVFFSIGGGTGATGDGKGFCTGCGAGFVGVPAIGLELATRSSGGGAIGAIGDDKGFCTGCGADFLGTATFGLESTTRFSGPLVASTITRPASRVADTAISEIYHGGTLRRRSEDGDRLAADQATEPDSIVGSICGAISTVGGNSDGTGITETVFRKD